MYRIILINQNIVPCNTSQMFPKPDVSASHPVLDDKHTKFCLFNARSINNKTLSIKDYIVERDIDITAITETWLNDTNSDLAVRNICPSGYSFSHVPRLNRTGGGVGVIYNNTLNITRYETVSYTSFEFMELLFQHQSCQYRIVVVYRSPSSNGLPLNTFSDEFSTLFERLVTSSGKLII